MYDKFIKKKKKHICFYLDGFTNVYKMVSIEQVLSISFLGYPIQWAAAWILRVLLEQMIVLNEFWAILHQKVGVWIRSVRPWQSVEKIVHTQQWTQLGGPVYSIEKSTNMHFQ